MKRSTIIDDSTIIKVYKVGDNQNLPDSNRIYDYSEYEDVTNDDYAQLGNNNDVNINFGNIDSPYIIKVISKYDPNKDDYTTIQQTVTMQTTINEYTGEFRTASYDNTIAFSTSSGQGQGDLPPEKTYKIGDYVWEDVDKDGIQNTNDNEKPLSNVLVTLTYPDGTSKSVRTDEDGKYQFDGLKNGLTYKITFETPEGYTPTLKHSGTNPALDSEA